MPTIDQRTRDRTRIQDRPVANTAQFVDVRNAGSGFGALQGFIADFADAQIKRDADAGKQRDEDTLAALSVSVAGRENEVRDSIRSGDYSKWGIHQDMARATFRRSAMEVFGESLAASDKTNYQGYLDQLDPQQDPVQATGDWIRMQTEGMDPMGAAKYLEVTEAYAGKMINARQKTLADTALKQGLNRIPLNIQAGLEANTFTSASDIETWATKFGSSQSLGQNALKARSQAMDAATKELLRIQATTTDKAQLEKVTTILNSSTANGLPLYETIDRKGREEVMSQALSAARRPNSVRTEQLHAEVTQRLQNVGVLGSGAVFGEEPDSLTRIFKDLTSQWGKSDGSEATNSAYTSLRGQVLKAMVKDGTANEIAKGFLRDGKYAPGDGDKVQDQLVKMAATNPEQADEFLALASKVAMEEGPSSVFRGQLNKSLRGEDLGNAMSTAALVRQMVQQGNLGYRQLLGTDEDVQAYYIALASSTGLPEAEQKLQMVRDSLREDGTFRGAYDNMWNFDNDERATKGKRGKRDFLVGFFNGLKDEEKLALGFTEGTEFNSLNPKYRNRMAELLDLAALATTTGDDNTEAQLASNLKLLVKNTAQIGWTINDEGKFEQEITMRDSPLLVRNAQGRLQRANGWGIPQAEAAEKYFMQDRYATVRTDHQFGGVESDERTGTHGDYAVTVTESKVPLQWRTFSSSQGAPISLWESTLANVPFIQEVRRDSGMVAFNVLPPGERTFTNPDGSTHTATVPEEFSLDNHMKYVWDSQGKQWMLRYRDGSTDDLNGINSVTGGILGTPEDAAKVFNEIPEDTGAVADKRAVQEAFKASNIVGKSQAELKAALEAYDGRMNPGTGDAPTGDEVPSQEAVDAQQRFMETFVDDMSNDGVYTGRASVRARDIFRRNKQQAQARLMEVFEGRREAEKLYGSKEESGSLVNMWEGAAEEVVVMAENLTKKDQFSMEPLGTPAENTLMFQIADDLSVSEGYFDRVTEGSVGFGFDINRPDAEDILDAAGAPSKKALVDGERMDRGTATRVMQTAVSMNMVSIKKQLDGVPLDAHQWESIAKYSYANPLVEQKRDPLHALAFRESSLKRDVVNKFGYLGLWQMGAAALMDGGYVTSSSNKDLDNPEVWTGKDGINSKADFLADVKAQENSVRALHKRNLRALKKWGVVSDSDDPGHIQGLLFASHLLGAGSIRKWVNKEGGGLKADANGTTAEEYYELGKRAAAHQPGQIPFEIEDAIRDGNRGRVSWLMRKMQPIEPDEKVQFNREVKGGQRGQYYKGAERGPSGTGLIRG